MRQPRSPKTTLAGLTALVCGVLLVAAEAFGVQLSGEVRALLLGTAFAAVGALGLSARDNDRTSEGAKVCDLPPSRKRNED